MQLNLDRVRELTAKATTEDLLDRATVYRNGMEPAALTLIEAELFRRGLDARDLEEHELARGETLRDAQDVALQCAHCTRPAVWREWAMYRLWGRIPLFPYREALCVEHRPVA